VAGATIDHMVAVTILIAALLLTMGIYNQMFASAVAYENNRKVAMKAVDIINTACICPGNPEDWGETNASLLGFGLQDPQAGGYALSPYSLMRLRTSSNDSQLVEYPPDSGLFYNNISANFGHGVLSPVGDCLNYTAAAKMLGINGTYGFRIDIVPTLDVNVSQVLGFGHLVLNVDVKGSGLPLSGATLNYHLFHVNKTDDEDPFPLIVTYSGIAPNPSGSVDIHFSNVTDDDPSYSFTVYVSLGGVTGVGYYTHNTIDSESQYIIPLIQDFDDGKIIIAHNWNGDTPAVTYNATFFILTSDFQLQQVQIANSTGLLNSGAGKPYNTTQVPAYEVGLLVISYLTPEDDMGNVILPWGVGTLGVSISFGGDPTGYSFVATELRQVSINDISYQAKVSTWSLNG